MIGIAPLLVSAVWLVRRPRLKTAPYDRNQN